MCLIVVIILNGLIFSAEIQSSRFDSLSTFRGISWGSSPEFVRDNETAAYMQSFKGFGIYAISYSGNFAGYKARIDYSFKDNQLHEGSYSFENFDNILRTFTRLKNELVSIYGSPNYWANKLITSDNIWIKINDYGKFKGPELYWEFSNGFIALHASRFKDKQTLTILFVHKKKISDYNSNKLNVAIP